MRKLEITVVVPERIADLVQNYIQYELTGFGVNQFCEYLRKNKVSQPMQYIPEMEIGIKHPDDEPIKIASYTESEHEEVLEYLQEYIEPVYSDNVLEEHLYSIDCIEGVFWPPQHVLDFIQSVKATGCSYFRFIK